ncbi:hypothetical protein MetMK1DRAFT_00026910 [Metallosphaera yellowstonensis MK1]|jgi:hypothetical protein|uniref:Uncharacterized protein n=2 Tax=Metallosphaera TaxID=41980 RepID=H2C7Z2_9CREN|nr:hypothetical protein MetMK1DRAFT_00026910 [Metallosphaera yellowstonensis MK1]
MNKVSGKSFKKAEGNSYLMKEREVEAKRLIGKKQVRGKIYEYEYYTLPLNLYIPKSMVEKFGVKYMLQVDEDTGTITIKPRSS